MKQNGSDVHIEMAVPDIDIELLSRVRKGNDQRKGLLNEINTEVIIGNRSQTISYSSTDKANYQRELAFGSTNLPCTSQSLANSHFGGYSDDTDEDEDVQYLIRPNTNHRNYKDKPRFLPFYCFSYFRDRCLQFASKMRLCCCGDNTKREARLIKLGENVTESFTDNKIHNQKYNVITFLPLVLFHQFKFFLNLYFLVMACSQFIPGIRIGYLSTYWGPLGFVLAVTLIREGIDDFRRYRRDREVNLCKYRKLTRSSTIAISSADMKVGDLIYVEKGQRVPADMILIRTTEQQGSSFIKTDQLDGETDWKLRLAIQACQIHKSDVDLFNMNCSVYAEEPQKDIHSFIGRYIDNDTEQKESLSIDNTLWANTVLASGTALGLVIYTGSDTRSCMNTSRAQAKVGLLDLEINNLTKILFITVIILAIIMVSIKGFHGPWYQYTMRFIILFSYIIPISLRVNLDIGKVIYSYLIQNDSSIPGTVARNTTIPEELGRIVYLLSDKTGTLTKNEMAFKKLHLGTVAFGIESMDEVVSHLNTAYSNPDYPAGNGNVGPPPSGISGLGHQPKIRRTVVTRVYEAVKAIALCHNVTPVYEMGEDIGDKTEADYQSNQRCTYQASSPDEVALVSWTESVGLTLVKRDLKHMELETPRGNRVVYSILHLFPFTSESKRMGIIVREEVTGDIILYVKGADSIMQRLVMYSDWLEEECGNMAREGLRTLIVARRTLTLEQFKEFDQRYHEAKISLRDRSARIASATDLIECNMEILCVTGVEDKLQRNVRPTLELLRQAGIRVWMLTGDKLETAACIAKSSRLVPKNQEMFEFKHVKSRMEAHAELASYRKKTEQPIIITGSSLQICLEYYEHEFIELICQSSAVVCCRCSPQQKADIVKLLQKYTGKKTAAVGDGGNDVSMIQAADAGIGIVGKEGKQAALAADFSITHFCYVAPLLLIHGRNSYKRSASLSQFVMHRGLIISIMQAVFSSVFYFSSIALYPGFLMVGYSTIYTMFPVFSLVLDKDVSSEVALTFPELYKELSKGRSLSYKTFFMWLLISIYQGGVIMYGAFLLFEADFIHIVSITFTALLITELLMVILTIRTFHYLMLVAEVLSVAFYIATLFILNGFFDHHFLASPTFIWKTIVITLISCVPLYILKFLRRKFSPPSYTKLT